MSRHLADLELAGSRSTALYRRRWLRFGAALDKVPLSSLDHATVYKWTMGLRAERTTKGTAPSSHYMRAAFAVLSSALYAAVASGLLRENPTTGMGRYLPKRGPAPRGRQRRCLQRDEVRLLLTSDKVPIAWRRLYACVVYLGLRAGEARGLRFSDLHVDTPIPYLHVERSWTSVPKNEPSVRDVPIHAEFMEFFLGPLVNHEWRALVKRAPRPDDHVFGTRKGTMRVCHNLAAELDKHLRKLGIDDGCTFHGLRHTAATLWSDDDVDEATIGALLGHAPGQTRHYARPSVARLARELRRFSLLRAQTVDNGSGVDISLKTSTGWRPPPMATDDRGNYVDETKLETRPISQHAIVDGTPTTAGKLIAGATKDLVMPDPSSCSRGRSGSSPLSASSAEQRTSPQRVTPSAPRAAWWRIPPGSTGTVVCRACEGRRIGPTTAADLPDTCTACGFDGQGDGTGWMKRTQREPWTMATIDGGLECRGCRTHLETPEQTSKLAACPYCRFAGVLKGSAPVVSKPRGGDVRDELVPTAARSLGGMVPAALALSEAFHAWEEAMRATPFDEGALTRAGELVDEKLKNYRTARGSR